MFAYIKETVRNAYLSIRDFKVSSLFSFAWWASLSAPKELYFGVIPPISTIATLALVSTAMAGGLWTWANLLTTAQAATVGFLPMALTFAPAVMGAAFINFWFNREINTFTLGAREVREGFVFSVNHRETDLRKLVEHLTKEVNLYYRQTQPNNFRDIPVPRICTFTDNHFKMITCEGRNPGKAAIFISSGALNFDETKLTRRQFAALVQKEIVKIYNRRGVSRTVVALSSDLSSTLSNLSEGNAFLKTLYILLMPLQLMLLIDKAVQRGFEYMAGKAVIGMNRGVDLVDGIDKVVCATLDNYGTQRELVTNAQLRREAGRNREPFPRTAFWAPIYKPFADWVDRNEYVEDDNTGYRFISAIDILVRELGFFFTELFKPKPRATNEKMYYRPLIKLDPANTASDAITLDNATTAQKSQIEMAERERSRQQFHPEDFVRKPWEEYRRPQRDGEQPISVWYDHIGPDGELPVVAQAPAASAPVNLPEVAQSAPAPIVPALQLQQQQAQQEAANQSQVHHMSLRPRANRSNLNK